MSVEAEVQTDDAAASSAAWWLTVPVAVLLALFIPMLGLVWSLAMAFTQRRDRRISGALLLIAGLALAGMVVRASTAGVVG